MITNFVTIGIMDNSTCVLIKDKYHEISATIGMEDFLDIDYSNSSKYHVLCKLNDRNHTRITSSQMMVDCPGKYFLVCVCMFI